ncbi:MAG: hypothetical protein ACP5T0_08180 [Verrucomicrobiia bacterium]
MKRPVNRMMRAAIGSMMLVWSIAPAWGESITNVVVANVTPSMFTVIWRAPQSAPGINVYADQNGSANLQGEVGIEYFPLHTGSPSAANAYFRRESKTQIRQRIEQSGYYIVRVLNCKPDTTYYFNIISRMTNGQTLVYPQNGLLSVRTAKTNSFLLDSRLLVVNIPGTNAMGRVLTLLHTNAAYPLAAVAGDGCPSNNVVFNLGELFAITGGNFSPEGEQQFVVSVLGDGDSVVQEFALDFTNGFSVATVSGLTVGTGYEQVTVELSQAIVRSGQNGSIQISVETTAPVTNLQVTVQLPQGMLMNPALGSLSPLIDDAAATIATQNGNWIVKLPLKPGLNLNGEVKNIAAVNFLVGSGLPSTIIVPVISGIQASKTNGQYVANTYALVGKIIIVGAQPVLEATLSGDGGRRLILYGANNATYQIQSTTVLGLSQNWAVVAEITITNTGSAIIPITYQNENAIFYRALEISGSKIGESISGDAQISNKEKAESKAVKVLPRASYKIY